MAEKKAAQAAVAASEEVQEKSLLDQIVEEGRFGTEPASRERGKNLVKEFVAQVLEGSMTIARDAEMMINARIAQIDHLVSIQLNEIMHNPSFQKLEGTWRGVKYLMDQSETGTMLKIRVLNCSKKELLKDLQRAPEFDQSALFKKVYEEEYGVFGGAPFGALVGDYEFGKHPEDIELLDQVSHVAAAAHAPFCTAANSDMLNMPSWTQLDAPRDLAKIMDTTEYAKWKGFRQSEDSRYVALALPRVLGRLALRQGHQAGGRLQLRRARGRKRSFEVPVDECGFRPRLADDQFLLAVRHVRCHAGRGRRRPGDRPAGPQLLHR